MIRNPPGGGDLAFFGMWYRFRVEETLAGLRPEEKEVVAWPNLGGGNPAIGRRYFVHAERSGDGKIRLAQCGNTRPTDEADKDIAYLRGRKNGTWKTSIAGSVLRHYQGSQFNVESDLEGPPRGLAGAKIKVQGQSRSFELTTDSEGSFEKGMVLPGTYTVTASAPGYRMPKPLTVEVAPNGCGIAHLGMFTNSEISGLVRRVDGTPAANVELDLIDEDPSYAPLTRKGKSVLTGAGGEFSITNLPSGRYILGVNIHESTRYPDQTPPTFYPGVAARTDAKVIELKPNQIVRNIVLTLQPARAFRIVRVHLRWPNSTIPHRGAVDAWVNKGIYVSNYDLRNGVFELRLLAGVDYWITAAALDETRKPTRFVRGTWVYPEPYRLPSGNEPVDITLTALFAEPQWANAIYPPVITKKK